MDCVLKLFPYRRKSFGSWRRLDLSLGANVLEINNVSTFSPKDETICEFTRRQNPEKYYHHPRRPKNSIATYLSVVL